MLLLHIARGTCWTPTVKVIVAFVERPLPFTSVTVIIITQVSPSVKALLVDNSPEELIVNWLVTDEGLPAPNVNTSSSVLLDVLAVPFTAAYCFIVVLAIVIPEGFIGLVVNEGATLPSVAT